MVKKMDSNTEYMMSVWLSGNVVGCVKEVTPCQVKLVSTDMCDHSWVYHLETKQPGKQPIHPSLGRQNEY